MLPNNRLELIRQTARKNEEAFRRLFDQYYPIVRKYRRQYYVNGYDKDDLDQEARMVLLRSACRFEAARKVGFGTFFSHNLRNRLFDLIRTNNAQKRLPVEPLTSFEANEYFYAAQIADDSASSPIDAVIVDEALRNLYSSCSPLERRAFNLMMSENGYADLAPKEQRGIINAFERCRRKFDGEIN